MGTRSTVSPDSLTVIMLTTQLGLVGGGRDRGDLSPYTARDWDLLKRRIDQSGLGGPAGMLGLDASSLERHLGISEPEAGRIAALLDRGVHVAFELERLGNLGIWAVTCVDDAYPARLREKLDGQSPPVLFGAGEIGLMSLKGLAVVGSRDVDDSGAAFAESIGRLCARSGLAVLSGAARGIDKLAMGAAVEAGGSAVGVLADSLERAIRAPDNRRAIHEGHLVLLTPYHPGAGFSVGAAMGRNKIIYGLADYGLVVSSSLGQGGTWAGACEVLRAKCIPLFVRSGDDVPPGNRELLALGALSFPDRVGREIDDLSAWLEEHLRQGEAQLPGDVIRPIRQGTLGEPALAQRRLLEARDGDEYRDATGSVPSPPDIESRVDVFDTVWPMFERYLSEPHTEGEIAARFGLVKAQVKEWMSRAVAERRAKKFGRPARYRSRASGASDDSVQPSLF